MTSLRKYLILFLPLFAACQAPSTAIPSLAYIDSGRVMQEYHGTLAKRAVIKQLSEKWGASLDSLSNVLRASQLAETVQQAQLTRYRTKLGRQLQAASQSADQELLKEVNRYLQEHGKRHHYDFILGANDSGNLVYAAPTKDITAEVVAGLNQQYDQHHPARQ